MRVLQKSGLCFPNKFGLITFRSLEEVMGKNGLDSILNLAGISDYEKIYPPDDLEKGFDFAELSAIGKALEDIYGQRGGRGFALRAGRATFSNALRNYGALAGIADPAFFELPLHAKLSIALPALCKILTQITDQVTSVEEKENEFIWTISKCPCCLNRNDADNPVCFFETGLLQESLRWISGVNEFRVNESKCFAVGDNVCEFVILKEPIT